MLLQESDCWCLGVGGGGRQSFEGDLICFVVRAEGWCALADVFFRSEVSILERQELWNPNPASCRVRA